MANWMKDNRTLYREGKIKKKRYEKLVSLGFEWTPAKTKPIRNSHWETTFKKLKSYKQKHGDIHVLKVSTLPACSCFYRQLLQPAILCIDEKRFVVCLVSQPTAEVF